MKNADLWRAAGEVPDYEEPDPPHPNDRPRCDRGHFLAHPLKDRGWIELPSLRELDAPPPYYREALPGEYTDLIEIFCPTCNSWFSL